MELLIDRISCTYHYIAFLLTLNHKVVQNLRLRKEFLFMQTKTFKDENYIIYLCSKKRILTTVVKNFIGL